MQYQPVPALCFFLSPFRGDRKKSKIWEAMIDTYTMAYLNKLPPAVSGGGGHNATLRVACECFRRGLSEMDAWDALQWYNANRCSPVWSEKALRHKLEDAARIVGGSGEMGKYARGQFQKKTRVFVPPQLPARAARPVIPICKQSAESEEAWWRRVAIERGCTLEQWDNAR